MHHIIAFDNLEEGVKERYKAETTSSEEKSTSVFNGMESKPAYWQGTIQQVNLSAVDYSGEMYVYYTIDEDVDIPEMDDYNETEKTTADKTYERLRFLSGTMLQGLNDGYSYDSSAYYLVKQKVTITIETVQDADGTTSLNDKINWPTTVSTDNTEVVMSSYTDEDGETVITKPCEWIRETPTNKIVDLSNISGVQAIAVDFGEFTLEAMKQLVFDVKMKAPADATAAKSAAYAYNNPAYYSTIKEVGTTSSLDGQAIKVGIGEEDMLTVAKQFTGNTLYQYNQGNYPELGNAQFTYTVTDDAGKAFADKRYYLWKDSGSDSSVIEGYEKYDPTAAKSTDNQITDKSYIEVVHAKVDANGKETDGTEIHYYKIFRQRIRMESDCIHFSW